MNEIEQRKLINRYKDYYKFYNTTVRPLEEKLPVQEVQGKVDWDEEVDTNTTKLEIVR